MKQSAASPEPLFVVFNIDHETEPEDEPPLVSDTSVVDVAHAVADALRSTGRVCEFLELSDSTKPLATVAARWRRSIFFNLVESLGRDAAREAEVPALLRKLGLAYTGNDATVLRLALDKGRVNRTLEDHGVPVPRGGVVRSSADAVAFATRRRLRFPLFVKPARLDASIGISQRSIVRDHGELRRQVDAMSDLGLAHIVVEEYIPGHEVSVAVCPSSSGPIFAANCIDFSSFGGHLAPIVTYDCKWMTGSEEYSAISVPAEELVDDRAVSAALRVARRALGAVGAVGPARVDLRFDAHGQPRVLDVNPNPDLAPDAGFARSLHARGYEYASMIDAIVEDAQRRRKHASKTLRSDRPRITADAAANDTRVLDT